MLGGWNKVCMIGWWAGWLATGGVNRREKMNDMGV